jgi:hypothetical protein
MDHTKILKRAWHILWRYRVLWLFGFILALTTASYGSSGPTYTFNANDFNFDRESRSYQLEQLDPETKEDLEEIVESLVEFFEDGIPSDVSNTFIAIGISLGIFILILVVVGKILRYVSETALISLVDEYEETEELQSIRYGFRQGWSPKAWRLFLIDLFLSIPMFLVFLIFLLLVLVPLLLLVTESIILGGLGTVASIGLFFLLIFLAIIFNVVVGFLKHFFRRACILENLGVLDSIKHGFLVVRENFKDAGIMWLIMVGINIGWSIVIIPLGLLVFVVGALVSGAVALAIGGASGLFFDGTMPWIFAAIVGLPILLVIVSVPLAFINGLRDTFVSSTWTLTYRELTTLEPSYLKALPEPHPPEDEEEEDTE